jgi:beta-glucosidase
MKPKPPSFLTPEQNARLSQLLSQMTLEEKVSLLSGKDSWNTTPIERMGIPSLTMSDGPHGVRAANPETGRVVKPATSFPTGIGLAATWDPALIEQVGEALGEEALALGCDILLGPCVNIVRHPLGGRNFETYSEDPFLAGRMAVAWIKGLQKRGVGASLKHFACNNQETERRRASSNLDERTLREIYLPAFEAAVREAQPWTVMCSYNRINGVYASQNYHLLTEILRDEWGYEGLVVSDWDANHTIFESVAGGLDLEMPGPARYFGRLLVSAVKHWQIEESEVDQAARRVLALIARSGRLDGSPRPPGSLDTDEHRSLARRAALESITLLKNDSKLLPLDAGSLQSLAVIGPNADEARIGGGGSSYVVPPYSISPLEGLRSLLGKGTRIEYEPGCDNFDRLPLARSEWLSLPDRPGRGLKAEFFPNRDGSGPPALESIVLRPDFWQHGANPIDGQAFKPYSARWSGYLTLPRSGPYTFRLGHTGQITLLLDGQVLFAADAPGDKVEDSFQWLDQALELEEGRRYALEVRFAPLPGQVFGHWKLCLAETAGTKDDNRIERAAELARRSQAAVIFAGMPEGWEAESCDRPHMRLPGPQDDLIRAVAAANPRTVVVINSGAPVEMPWLADVPAMLLAYYPGQEGGQALVEILLGNTNPSGKLPVTFPARLEDSPAYINGAYEGGREINYGEGIFTGYRYFDQRQVEPLFPFGHGLSYTSFEFGPLESADSFRIGEELQVSVHVRNAGSRPGSEVLQLYVRDLEASLPRPPKELKGFQKVWLAPGERKTVNFELDQRALSFYHPATKQWTVEPGTFEILVGSSSQDIRLRASFELL